MEGQVTDEEQEVIITNNDLLLVLKQWKGALNWIMPSLLCLLKNNDLALRARSLFSGGQGARALSYMKVHNTVINFSQPDKADKNVEL